MKKLLFAVGFVLLATPAFADVWVKGHYRTDGTYVPGHWRTDPNTTDEDNYNQYPNRNPHNGAIGGKPYQPPPLTPYPPNTDIGTPPPFERPRPYDDSRPYGPKVEVPKLDAPAPRLGRSDCKRTSIYDPPCPT